MSLGLFGVNPVVGALAQIGFQTLTQGMMNAVSNMMMRAMQSGIEKFLDQMTASGQMDQGTADQIRGSVDRTIDGLVGQNPVSPFEQGFAQQQQNLCNAAQDTGKSVYDHLREECTKETAETKDEKGNRNGTNGHKGSSGDSWYVKLSKALGTAMNNQADAVEKLADEVSATFKADGSGVQDQKKNFDMMMELQAQTRVLQTLIETGKNAVTSIGDSIAAAGRKN